METDLVGMEIPPKCTQVTQSKWGQAPDMTYSKKLRILLTLF